MKEFTIVDERPPAISGTTAGQLSPITQAVLNTLQSGQTVRVEVADRTRQHVIACRCYQAAKKRGLVAHARYRADHLLLWVEPGPKEATE